MTAKHTPLPWEAVETHLYHPAIDILGPMDDCGIRPIPAVVLATQEVWLGKSEEQMANVHFIVQACNSHEVLLEALRTLLIQSKAMIDICEFESQDTPMDYKAIAQAESALAAAGG